MDNLIDISGFQLPPLRCSLPVKCHPDYKQMRELSDSWLLSFFSQTSDHASASKQLLMDFDIPLLTCLAHPESCSHRLLVVSKLITWFFVWDDFNDLKSLGAEIADATQRFEYVVGILEGRGWDENAEMPDGVRGLLFALADWWNTDCKDMPPQQQARFVETMKDYLSGVKFQMRCRIEKRIMDLQTYIETRREVSACFPAFVLLEYALELVLDEEVLQNTPWRRMVCAACDHISWSNDVVSCRREISNGDYFNLPSTIFKNSSSKISFQYAVEEACRMMQEAESAFVEASNEIKGSKMLEQKPELGGFVEGLGYWMSGNVEWCRETKRFDGTKSVVLS